MRTLLAFELKKILNRKTLWLALALGMVMWVQVRGTGYFYYRLSGYAQGVKEVTMQYEGQVLTEALQTRIQADFDSYVAAHPDSFMPEPMDEGTPGEPGSLVPSEVATPYDSGVWIVFANLTGGSSLEDQQTYVRNAQECLATGIDERGDPLTDSLRRAYQQTVQRGVLTPMVHYAKGWEEFFQAPNENGMWVLLAIGVALLGLFGGESSARMESIVLTARARRRAVTAKLLAAAMVAGGSVALFFGLQFAAMAYAWGLQGALLPATALALVYWSMPIVAVFALTVLALMLAAVACAAVVAWSSARFRPVLLTMLSAGAILWGMYALWVNSLKLSGPPYHLYGNPVYEAMCNFLYALPVNTLMDTSYITDRVTDEAMLTLLVLVPLALTAVLCWLAGRTFLRRRKV